MRTRCSCAVTIVATFAVLAAGTQVTAQDRGQRTAYKPTASDFVVVCTLFKGRAPGATASTPKEPITYDPRFEIGARVERVTLGKSPWRAGDRITFVIHSPTVLLANDFSGQEFELTFSPFRPTTKSEKVWFEPETRYLLQRIERAKKTTDEWVLYQRCRKPIIVFSPDEALVEHIPRTRPEQ
jgi:hypothetical protein